MSKSSTYRDLEDEQEEEEEEEEEEEGLDDESRRFYEQELSSYSFTNVTTKKNKKRSKKKKKKKNNKKQVQFQRRKSKSFLDDQVSDEDFHSSDEDEGADLSDVGEDGNIIMVGEDGKEISMIDKSREHDEGDTDHRNIETALREQEFENMPCKIPEYVSKRLEKHNNQDKDEKAYNQRVAEFTKKQREKTSGDLVNKYGIASSTPTPTVLERDFDDYEDDQEEDAGSLEDFVTDEIEYESSDEEEEIFRAKKRRRIREKRTQQQQQHEGEEEPFTSSILNHLEEESTTTTTDKTTLEQKKKKDIFTNFLRYIVGEELDRRFVTAIQKHQNGQLAAPSSSIFIPSTAKKCLTDMKTIQKSREEIISVLLEHFTNINCKHQKTTTTTTVEVTKDIQRFIRFIHMIHQSYYLRLYDDTYMDRVPAQCIISNEEIKTDDKIFTIELKTLNDELEQSEDEEEEEETKMMKKKKNDNDEEEETEKKYYLYLHRRFSVDVRLMVIYMHWTSFCLTEARHRIDRLRLPKQNKFADRVTKIFEDKAWINYMWQVFSNAEMFFVSRVEYLCYPSIDASADNEKNCEEIRNKMVGIFSSSSSSL